MLYLLCWCSFLFAQNKYEIAFDRVWAISQSDLHPKELVDLHFTPEKVREIFKEAKSVKSWTEFEELVNPFLLSLGVSHTYFYSIENPDYYFFRSLFTTKELSAPQIHHIGIQSGQHKGEVRVKSVLHGYPADKAGMKRGDTIISVDSQPFHPLLSFKSKNSVKIEIRRDGKAMKLDVQPVLESLHQSFVNASRNSARVIQRSNKKVGYFKLWTGTHDQALKDLKDQLQKFESTDALILDLRDGFGGAWWNYLDPFFENRDGFFVATRLNRKDKPFSIRPGKPESEQLYAKPMIVLANEGVRSGKEALVYQFKKSKRATVIGQKTSGQFSMGRGVFSDKDYEYIYYMSSGEMLLDGNKIEGVGVAPDQVVDYPLDRYFKEDPQLEAGLKKVMEILGEAVSK